MSMYSGILLLVWYVGRVAPGRGRVIRDNGVGWMGRFFWGRFWNEKVSGR